MNHVNGARELFPGIAVHHVGGHTAGLQVVTVETARGTAVIASDAIKMYRSLSEAAPDPLHHDIPGMLSGYQLCRELASNEELIVPGHDPEVLTRFETVADGIAVVS